MLTKTNIGSVQNYLGGNTDRQQFENDKQNVDVADFSDSRDTFFSDFRGPMIVFSDSRDPNRVPKTP